MKPPGCVHRRMCTRDNHREGKEIDALPWIGIGRRRGQHNVIPRRTTAEPCACLANFPVSNVIFCRRRDLLQLQYFLVS